MKVIVFGSNSQGFHGAGSAGYAMRGTPLNTWRKDPDFLRAMKGPDKRGKWAVLGVSRGFQQGKCKSGASYAIETCTKPGAKRSLSLYEIVEQVEELIDFIKEHPDFQFGLTGFGAGYSGWPVETMKPIWERILEHDNVRWISLATNDEYANS